MEWYEILYGILLVGCISIIGITVMIAGRS